MPPNVVPIGAGSNAFLEAALLYAGLGIPVFPARIARDGSKRGLVSKDSADSNGAPWGSTTDPDLIKRYWQRWPRALLGIATGSLIKFGDIEGRLTVIDLDTARPGRAKSGMDSLTEFGRNHGGTFKDGRLVMTQTAAVRTPSGGLHIYYLTDPNRHVKSISGWRTSIDIRGSGGMVIAPPSGRYRFLDGQALTCADDIADCPMYLEAQLPFKSLYNARTLGRPVHVPVAKPPAGMEDTLRADGARSSPATMITSVDDWYPPLTPEGIGSLLTFLHPDKDYHLWLLMGMCLHEVFDGAQAALDQWTRWSSGAGIYVARKYRRGETLKKWNGFHAHRSDNASIGTLITKLREAAAADGRLQEFEDTLERAKRQHVEAQIDAKPTGQNPHRDTSQNDYSTNAQ